jgi:hypothetical protein
MSRKVRIHTELVCNILEQTKRVPLFLLYSIQPSNTAFTLTILLLFIFVPCGIRFLCITLQHEHGGNTERKTPPIVCSEFLPLANENYTCHKNSQHQQAVEVPNMYSLNMVRCKLFSQLTIFFFPWVLPENNC